MINIEELKEILKEDGEVVLSKKQMIGLITFSVKYPSSATTLAINLNIKNDIDLIKTPPKPDNQSFFTYLI